MGAEVPQYGTSRNGKQAMDGASLRSPTVPVPRAPQDGDSPCLSPAFQSLPPLPPLAPQLERYLNVKSSSQSPSNARNVRHFAPPPSSTSYSVSLYYPSKPVADIHHPQYRPYYLVQDDSDPPHKPKHLTKLPPATTSHKQTKKKPRRPESNMDPTTTASHKSEATETRSSANDRFRSFSVLPRRPVVGGDSVFRTPYLNIPPDNLSFALAESSFLPLGQGAPRNAAHAVRFDSRTSQSKEFSDYDPKSIERGRMDGSSVGFKKSLDDKLQNEGVVTFRSLGVKTREAFKKGIEPAGGEVPVNGNRSQTPGLSTSLSPVRVTAEGLLIR
ncbi:hypothetical protein BJ508DRAFT_343865 [Ascobolus immersus RN42]|uniref:Uncharacterized protein n=1 Tax=Ascobolus immersus RN42 TaxID=1160509 RepID=A0A3N4IB47_ASCIM|nr:hypothetical protein BJ508DRAFT_343865 [Ascobolus immersus RN42]